MNPAKTKSISFCISCRNRLWQLRETLPENLSLLEKDAEITLVDYGSSDGLSDWLWGNYRTFIENKKLSFFEVRNRVSWNCPKAKNLAHRIAAGNYLLNLDADNFLTSSDLKHIRKAVDKKLPSHQWSGIRGDGSYGRIGMPRDLFFRLGGYDETLLPTGGQDVDLIRRIHSLGIRCIKLPCPEKQAIQNETKQKLSEIADTENPDLTYETINNFNLTKSKIRLQLEGPLRTDGFTSYRGLLNGKPVMIDGFNQVHPVLNPQN